MKGRKKPDHFAKPHKKTPGFVVQIPEGLFVSLHNTQFHPLIVLRNQADKEKQTSAVREAAPVAYWLKRGETIRGPLERAAILQAAKGKKLMTGDQIANAKDGPWQNITKEQLQQMQQGSDVEIK